MRRISSYFWVILLSILIGIVVGAIFSFLYVYLGVTLGACFLCDICTGCVCPGYTVTAENIMENSRYFWNMCLFSCASFSFISVGSGIAFNYQKRCKNIKKVKDEYLKDKIIEKNKGIQNDINELSEE